MTEQPSGSTLFKYPPMRVSWLPFQRVILCMLSGLCLGLAEYLQSETLSSSCRRLCRHCHTTRATSEWDVLVERARTLFCHEFLAYMQLSAFQGHCHDIAPLRDDFLTDFIDMCYLRKPLQLRGTDFFLIRCLEELSNSRLMKETLLVHGLGHCSLFAVSFLVHMHTSCSRGSSTKLWRGWVLGKASGGRDRKR